LSRQKLWSSPEPAREATISPLRPCSFSTQAPLWSRTALKCPKHLPIPRRSPSAGRCNLQPDNLHAPAARHRVVSLDVREAVQRQLAQHRDLEAVGQQPPLARGYATAPKASGKAAPGYRILLIERESPVQKISVFVREQINESVPVGHFDLWQRLRVHHVIVADDAVKPQDVRRHRIHFVIGK
jgi:hypothetical protein